MVRYKGSEDRLSFVVAFVTLFLFWILVSSAIDVQHILIGAVAAFVVSHFSHDLLLQKGQTLPSLKALYLFFPYLAHLSIEIIKANIHVARIVLDPNLPIAPSIVKFKTKLKGETAKTSLANSITLTPGTLTVDIIGDDFYVHTLTKDAAEEVKHWHMEKRLAEVEDAA
jgi:multicomponent Na+:H+ antiporter subunit E